MGNISLLLAATLLIAACHRDVPGSSQTSAAATFVGSETCSSCHLSEYSLWQASHHQLAMQEANSATVLGNFSAELVRYFDTETGFFRHGGKFFVRTQGADGSDQEFAVTHTFGVTPLQQYLVDGPRGRKQVLPFAWDSRTKSEGGQRWFHLYPDEFIGPGDPLHWTGRYFNWNYMCAECHSTNVQLGYELESDSFATTYDELAVGCEACHGPGSRHVRQANLESFDESLGLPVGFNDRDGAASVMNGLTGIAERTRPNLQKQEPESCGRYLQRLSRSTLCETQGGTEPERHLLQGILNEALPPIARATMLTLLEPITDAEDRDWLPLQDNRALPDAIDEYRVSMTAAAAMPGAALNLADFEARLGNSDAAARLFEHAIRIGADAAPVQHAYGLYLVRSAKASEALAHLRRAVEIAPDVAQFVYAYGVALNSLGEPDRALDVLRGAHKRFAGDFDIGWALATIYRDSGDRDLARAAAVELREHFPDNVRINSLIDSLED